MPNASEELVDGRNQDAYAEETLRIVISELLEKLSNRKGRLSCFVSKGRRFRISQPDETFKAHCGTNVANVPRHDASAAGSGIDGSMDGNADGPSDDAGDDTP